MRTPSISLSKFRKRLLVPVLSLALVLLGTFHFVSFASIKRLASEYTPASFSDFDTRTRQALHYSNYRFSLSDAFERKVGGWDAFAAKPKSDRCFLFFRFLNEERPNWEVEFFKGRHFDKSVVRKNDIINSELKKIRNKRPKSDSPSEFTNEEKKEANVIFDKKLQETTSLEQDMADTMTIIRLFGACFFGEDSVSIEGVLEDLYNQFSAKIIPFFNADFPKTSTGDIDTNTEWPFDTKGSVENNNLLDFYYKNMDGTGIVLSTATRHSRDVVKLIHALRALGNTLPIEVVYRSDLSMRAKQAILLAGASPKNALLGDQMTDQNALRRALEKVGLGDADISALEFPQQKVTLVNMQKTLSKLAKNDFSKYDNKLLALFFNSFEKVFLFDTDAVPLLALEQLQNFKEFTETGAYFFRDRTLMDKNDWIETNYFAKLMPHESDKLDMVMGVKPVTSHTLGNSYMKGWRHCQEAGLVMLDRRRHFCSLLTLFPLSLWGEPVRSSIWGDKEMYWLSMSIAGDENYTFNQHGASSVGELTLDASLKHYNNSKASELCGSHPGHVSADGQLLWINSGFSYCKKNGYARDKSRFPFSAFQNMDDVKSLFENPLKIRHAISPPELPTLRDPGGSVDLSSELQFMLHAKKRRKDVDEMPEIDQIDTYDPQKGWIKSKCCLDYQYCAYNAVQAVNGSKGLDESGKIFAFDPEDTKRFDILGAIWASSLRTSTLNQRDSPDAVNSSQTRDLPLEKSGSDSSTQNQMQVPGSPSPSAIYSSYLAQKNSKSSKAGDQPANSPDDTERNDLKVIDHLGMAKESSPKNSLGTRESGTQEAGTNIQSKVNFDSSRVRERPEKLRNDIKEVISRLRSSS